MDIKGFFDNIDREQLTAFLQDRIADSRVLRLIRKWLAAGVLEEGLKVDPARGTPQGAPISPLLANVYLHNVLDQWFALQWRPQKAIGQAYMVRYADDFVLGFEHRQDAERFLKDLEKRFTEYGLELHPEKTRLIEFGKEAARNRRRRGERRPETFDFLRAPALLPNDPNRQLRTGTQARTQTRESHLKSDKESAALAYARRPGGNRAMARKSTSWLARLLRCPHKLQTPGPVQARPAVAMAPHSAPPVANRKLCVGAAGSDVRSTLAPRPHHPPMARHSLCRHPLQVRAGCANAHVRIRAGGDR